MSMSAASSSGSITVVREDEHPRPDTTLQQLAKLRPAFRPDGTVTAGNSSGLNDGSAALVLVSEERLREIKVKPPMTAVSPLSTSTCVSACAAGNVTSSSGASACSAASISTGRANYCDKC